MEKVTAKERISRILKRLPVDRIGIAEEFWEDTRRKWSQQGYIKKDETVWDQNAWDHFNLDIRDTIPFNLIADLDFREEIIEETEETKLVRDGNGALFRWHKLHQGAPEHVGFAVTDRESWEGKVKPLLLGKKNYLRRIDFSQYRSQKEKCMKKNLYLVLKQGGGIFAYATKVCGHEALLTGMALDPEWVKDMLEVYTDLIISLAEILIEKEGKPDGFWISDDLGYKFKPFMSPAMYKEIIQPSHKKLFDFAHFKGLPVFIHSCGFVEPLLPGLIEAGIDCLQALEVKAGMDLLKLKKFYGDRISFMGGIDVRALISNDFDIVSEEINKKVPVAMKGGGYFLHSDHSIPDQVNYETYKYFLETAVRVGTY